MTRRRALWLSGLATLAVGAVLVVLDARMRDAGGVGMVDFELAGTRAEAERMMAAWGAEGRDAARWSLRLDFVFLVVYGTFGALAALALRSWWPSRLWRRLGLAAAVAMPVAALFDAVEDVNLLLVLDGRGGTAAPQLARAFALGKFALVAFALAYLLAGLALRVRRRERQPRPRGLS
jgi:hypothetical protein